MKLLGACVIILSGIFKDISAFYVEEGLVEEEHDLKAGHSKVIT